MQNAPKIDLNQPPPPPVPILAVDTLAPHVDPDGTLVVSASGWVSTKGWSWARLKERAPVPDEAGEIVLDFVAIPPSGIVAQVLTKVTAGWELAGFAAMQPPPQRIRVVASTNEASFAFPAAPEGPSVPASGLTYQELVRLPMKTPVDADGGRLRLTLTGINDSRCPSGVMCIWEGELAAEVDVQLDGAVQHVHLSQRASVADLPGGYRLELKDTFVYPGIAGGHVESVTVLVLR